jgi:hypothetical protein
MTTDERTDDDVLRVFRLYDLARAHLEVRQRLTVELDSWRDEFRAAGLPDSPVEADCAALAGQLRDVLAGTYEPPVGDWVRVGLGADPETLIALADERAATLVSNIAKVMVRRTVARRDHTEEGT